MTDELESALVAAPDDLALWSVYADHLERGGDHELASWIQLHLALEAATPAPSIFDEAWLRAMAVKIPTGGEPAESATVAGAAICAMVKAREGGPAIAIRSLFEAEGAWRCKVVLRHGLVARAELGMSTDHTNEDEDPDKAFAGLRLLFGSVIGRFVRYVRIRVDEHNYGERQFSAIVAAITVHRQPALARIELDAYDMLPTERERGNDLDLTDDAVSALFGTAPRLETLELRWMQSDGGQRREYRRSPNGIEQHSLPYQRDHEVPHVEGES